MKYGFVLFPSKELQDKANSYRKRFDPHYSLIAPHITLKDAFEADTSEIEDIIEKAGKISLQYQPFKLKVLKTSTFQPVTNTIYLKVEPVPELEGLHDSLNKEEFGGSASPYSFVPHITIGQKLSDQEHSDVFGQMSMLDLTHEEEATEFHLVGQQENGTWKVISTFQLGKGA